MQIAPSRHTPQQHPQQDEAHGVQDFNSLISSSFVPLKITTERNQPFVGQTTAEHAGDVVFTEVVASPHLVERTASTIAAGGSGFYKVSLMLSGSSLLMQDGRELVLRPGDISVYDTSRPYSLLFDQEFRNLIMMFPKEKLELPVPFTEQLTATSLSAEHEGLAPVIRAFLSQFPTQLAPLDPRLRAKLAHTSLDLMSTLFSSILDAEPHQRDPHQVMLQKITTYIEENLGSTTLSPGSIAGAHFISTRHLHSLFKQSDTTVSAWIKERRLERCRTDLLDPVLADRTVSAIAHRWGFPDAAHFSRAFKAAYGTSPSELRNQ